MIVYLRNNRTSIRVTRDSVYFFNGVAYDFYSINELHNRTGVRLQWKTFPLPDEQLASLVPPWTPYREVSIAVSLSPPTSTGLAFLEHIYIATAPDLKDRQANIERMFAQIGVTSFEWRTKWSRESCNSPENEEEVRRKLNLRSQSISKAVARSSLNIECHLSGGPKRKKQCAVTMEHIDIWHDIVARNLSLALVLEDDAVFVSSFREKFERTIYTAIRTGALRIHGLSSCFEESTRVSMDEDEWFTQDPVIFIGGCMQFNDGAFKRDDTNAPPLLSTHKEEASRCSHAYLLTACSAQALIRQIAKRKKPFAQSDLLLNSLVAASLTLQSFWLDPPIVYQGNRVNDLDGIPSFHRVSYQ